MSARRQVFIILFRGVGGATQLPVVPLRKALEDAGFEKVATYINSGNAVVRSHLGRGEVIAKIADITSRAFGFVKGIHAPTLDEWSDLIANNPFPDALEVPKYLHAALLSEKPDPARVEALLAVAAAGERFEIIDKVAYLHTPNGFGTSKLAAKFDRSIGVQNTARNWNTVLKLRDLALAAHVG